MSALSDFSFMDVLFGKDDIKLEKDIKVEVEQEKSLNVSYSLRRSSRITKESGRTGRTKKAPENPLRKSQCLPTTGGKKRIRNSTTKEKGQNSTVKSVKSPRSSTKRPSGNRETKTSINSEVTKTDDSTVGERKSTRRSITQEQNHTLKSPRLSPKGRTARGVQLQKSSAEKGLQRADDRPLGGNKSTKKSKISEQNSLKNSSKSSRLGRSAPEIQQPETSADKVDQTLRKKMSTSRSTTQNSTNPRATTKVKARNVAQGSRSNPKTKTSREHKTGSGRTPSISRRGLRAHTPALEVINLDAQSMTQDNNNRRIPTKVKSRSNPKTKTSRDRQTRSGRTPAKVGRAHSPALEVVNLDVSRPTALKPVDNKKSSNYKLIPIEFEMTAKSPKLISKGKSARDPRHDTRGRIPIRRVERRND